MVRCFSITYQEVIVTMSETKSEAPSIQLIAHRGYSGRYPENTLLAYEAAVQHGAQCFELDLQMSNDGVPFLHHDETLMRMAGLDQDFRDTDAKTIKSLRASYPSRFGDAFSDNKFTTFKKFCKWLALDNQLLTFVEIKQESIDRWGIPAFVDAALSRINAAGVEKQCVIISFNENVIEYTRKVSDVRCGWVLPAWSDTEHKIARALNPDFLFCDTDSFPDSNEDVWSGPWQWTLYNLDDVASAAAYIERCFYSLETNEIGLLMSSELMRSKRS